jgi:hypothetical protein
MKKTLRTVLIALFLIGGVLSPIGLASTVAAQNPIEAACSDTRGESSLCNDTEGDSFNSVIGLVVSTLLFIVGLVSVIMIIVGGIRFTTSAGNASSVTAAKNTILYAIVGLLVAFFAYAIVYWVLDVF